MIMPIPDFLVEARYMALVINKYSSIYDESSACKQWYLM